MSNLLQKLEQSVRSECLLLNDIMERDNARSD